MAGKEGGPSILSLALWGGAAYLAYEFFFASSSSAAASPATSTAPPSGATPAPAPVAAPAPPQSGFNSLDQTYQRLVQAISQNAATDSAITQVQGQPTATPQVFNYYLAKVSSYSIPGDAIASLWGGYPDPPISLGAFWSGASGWLAQNKGLTGYRGRGLAGIIAAAGRRR